MENTDSVPTRPKYKRIILKLSGEVLRNTQDGEPIDASIVLALCEEIKKSMLSESKSDSSLAGGIYFEV